MTDDHPFWVENIGWVDSDDLEPGMLVMDLDGSWHGVKSMLPVDKEGLAYNFEVGDFHTYFVGESDVWVHNCPEGPTDGNIPLLGNNAKVKKDRTNTDLDAVNDRSAAKSIFRNQTKDQKIKQFENRNGDIIRRSEDGTQIRMNRDGSTRIDLPGRGSRPNGETIHFNP